MRVVGDRAARAGTGAHALRALAVAALLLVVAAPGRAARAPPAPAPLVAVEGGNGISLGAELPGDGKLVRSVRLSKLAASRTLTLKLLPGDLISANGDRIERTAITLGALQSLGDVPQDLRVEIAGLVRPGTYTGTIELRANELPGTTQAIPITLAVRPLQPLALAPETPKLALQIATHCDWLTGVALGPRGCPRTVSVATTGTMRGTTPPEVDLLLVDANGSALPQTGGPTVAPNGRLLSLTIANNQLAPGHYSGHIRATYDFGATLLTAPVEIDVRRPAWWAVGPIVLGILLGWLWAFMLRTGNDLAAGVDRLSRNQRYAAVISDEARVAITTSSGPIWQFLNEQQVDRAKTELDLQDRCITALRELAHIRATRQLDAAADQQAAALVAAAAANQADQCGPLLAALRQAPLQGGGGMGFRAAARALADRVQRAAVVSGPNLRTWFIAKGLKWGIWAILLMGLTWAGLYTLYVTNGARFGEAPLSDFLTLVAWGVTADVSSRTIATFKGPTPG
jgi:hypothetical protein